MLNYFIIFGQTIRIFGRGMNRRFPGAYRLGGGNGLTTIINHVHGIHLTVIKNSLKGFTLKVQCWASSKIAYLR